MTDWLARFESSLEAGKLLRETGRILVGVSGGPDSVALLLLLCDLRARRGGAGFPEIIAVHVNHGLRGRDGDLDEKLVMDLASGRGIEVLVERGDARAEARREGLSPEAGARSLRYRAFRKWAEERAVDAIFLAHHRGDQAETVLLRASRGTGIRGLRGIPRERPLFPGSRTRVARPLLDWSKKDLLGYLAVRGHASREDSTNADLSVPRNCVRHAVLPLLERSVHPGAPSSLSRLAETAARHTEDLEVLGAKLLAEARVEGAAGLSAKVLRAWPRTVVYEALRKHLLEKSPAVPPRLPSRPAWEAVLDWFSGVEPGEARLEAGGFEFDLRYGLLRASPRQRGGGGGSEVNSWSEATSAPLSVPGSAEWAGWEVTSGLETSFLAAAFLETAFLETAFLKDLPAAAPDGPFEARLDARAVLALGPLEARSRREGDRFWPLGAPGPKKLKEFFRERRVWPSDRGRVPLVASGPVIVWVVGHRIAHQFRVTPETKSALRLRAGRLSPP